MDEGEAWHGRVAEATSQTLSTRVLEVRKHKLGAHGLGAENHVPPHAQTTARTQSHAGADAFSRIAVAAEP